MEDNTEENVEPRREVVAMWIVGKILFWFSPTLARWVLRIWFEVIAIRGRITRRWRVITK